MEVGTSLDFLAKSLVRTRQLAQITNLVRNAEAVRAQREAAEGADRRAREAARLKADWVYSQIQQVHKKTVFIFFFFILFLFGFISFFLMVVIGEDVLGRGV